MTNRYETAKYINWYMITDIIIMGVHVWHCLKDYLHINEHQNKNLKQKLENKEQLLRAENMYIEKSLKDSIRLNSHHAVFNENVRIEYKKFIWKKIRNLKKYILKTIMSKIKKLRNAVMNKIKKKAQTKEKRCLQLHMWFLFTKKR